MPRVKAVPAVWVAGGVGIVKVFAAALATVNVAEPVMVGLVTEAAVSVVLPALNRVIDAVPTPVALKVTADPVVQLPPAAG